MRCPYCASDHDRVVDSRAADDGRAVRRRRECTACQQRFSTYERVDHAPLAVRKRSGSIQPFDPDRLHAGMQKATANLDIDPDVVRFAAARVEAHLRAMGESEIGTDVIGGHVLEALRALHPVAYMRFASVHKVFTSADDFARELAALDDDRLPAGHDPAG
ncbi:transcriptional regulator NrdR [Euzebya sp.]|uniref:transcriptional regulator NrdR n=1 Tax=Euzebya sp. TaxID=1971409 RepID=UPI003519899A